MSTRMNLISKKKALVEQVLYNCRISDAHHAGMFSICGLALRLRDLYKWEHGLAPWQEHESGKVLEWIGEREEGWEGLADSGYRDIAMEGHAHDPFDIEGINRKLADDGLYYGAGYAHGMKPTFFLAQVEEKRVVDNTPVYVLGKELARDLLTLPALSQEGRIMLRKDSARMYMWDQMFYLKKSGRFALMYALNAFGIAKLESEPIRQHLDSMLALYQETYIHHELGEIHDTHFDRKTWRQIIRDYPLSGIEFFARAIKDLLADTNENGTLWRLIHKKDDIALAFYVAFFDGLSRAVFPELRQSFKTFMNTKNWSEIEEVVRMGNERARRYGEMIMAIYRQGLQKNDKKWVKDRIDAHLKKLQVDQSALNG